VLTTILPAPHGGISGEPSSGYHTHLIQKKMCPEEAGGHRLQGTALIHMGNQRNQKQDKERQQESGVEASEQELSWGLSSGVPMVLRCIDVGEVSHLCPHCSARHQVA
jgi:hypothetical protein